MGKVLFGTTIPDAADVPYDNSVSGLIANQVQAAIDEIASQIDQGASPGFTYGRSGNSPTGTWMLNESVPSNIAGRWVYTANTIVRKIFISNQDITTFTISVYYHSGNEIGLTFLFSKTVTAARGGSFDVNVACPQDVQLACQISDGSAKNPVVGMDLKGDVV